MADYNFDEYPNLISIYYHKIKREKYFFSIQQVSFQIAFLNIQKGHFAKETKKTIFLSLKFYVVKATRGNENWGET